MLSKRFSNSAILFLACVILLVSTALVCAAMSTGFVVEDVGENTSVIFERLELKTIDEPETKTGFSCFDVNSNGEYALGFDGGKEDIILVFNSDSSYLYGFSLSDNGSFGIALNQDHLIIYRERSGLAVSVDKNGRCLDMKEIQNTPQNDAYWWKEVYANKRSVNGSIYTAEHWLLSSEELHWGTYQRLVKTTPEGESVILLDTTNATLSRGFGIAIMAAIILSAAAVVVIGRIKK